MTKDISGVHPVEWRVSNRSANFLFQSSINSTADILTIQPPGDGYGEMRFNTKTANGGLRGETMRLTYDGKVGINFPLPEHVLDINSSAGDSNIRIISQDVRAEMMMGLSSSGGHISIIDNSGFEISTAGSQRIMVDSTGRVNINNRINLSNTAPPATSAGASGDKMGDIAADSSNLYYCTADYTTGGTPIWVKTAWQSW
jgi:hypothetical protein